MLKCGGKDVHYSDGTIVKDVFEGFTGSNLERFEMLRYRKIGIISTHTK